MIEAPGDAPPDDAQPPSAADRDESKEYRRALTLIKAGQFARAREVLEQYIHENPGATKALNKYAFVLLELGRFRSAKRVLQGLIAKGQRDFYTHFLLGRAFHREGNFTVAVQQYGNALALDPNDIYTINGLATVLREQGETAKAVALLSRGLGVSREDPTTFIQLADIYIEEDDLEAARKWIDQGLQEHPNDLGLRCLKAERFSRAREFPSAESAFEQIARDFPNRADGKLGLARALATQGKENQALEELNVALGADPRNLEVYEEKARLLIRKGEPGSALEAMEMARNLAPEDYKVMVALAEVLVANRLRLKAYMTLKRAVAANSSYHLSHYLIGQLYLDEELYETAADELETSLASKPDHWESRSALAEALARTGRFDQARAQADAVLERHPEARQARFALALAELAGGEDKRAEKLLSELAAGSDRVSAAARIELDRRKG